MCEIFNTVVRCAKNSKLMLDAQKLNSAVEYVKHLKLLFNVRKFQNCCWMWENIVSVLLHTPLFLAQKTVYPQYLPYRRSIYTEEKAKIVAAVWWTD